MALAFVAALLGCIGALVLGCAFAVLRAIRDRSEEHRTAIEAAAERLEAACAALHAVRLDLAAQRAAIDRVLGALEGPPSLRGPVVAPAAATRGVGYRGPAEAANRGAADGAGTPAAPSRPR